MKYATLILIALVLVSCSGAASRAPATIFPTATETVRPGLPTQTATATSVPAPVQEAVQSSIKDLLPAIDDLPSWMKAPETSVIAAWMIDDMKGFQNITFFNAATGETYEMSMPYPARGFFWYDNMNFGLLSPGLETAYRINLQTGQIEAEILSSQSTRLLRGEGGVGVVRFEEAPNEFIFDNGSNSLSRNKTFAAEWIDRQKNILVTDTRTGEVVWKSATPENVWTTEFIWSPIDDSHLAFLQGSPAHNAITENISLIIVDVTSGEIISTYSGDFGGLEWSPDGKMILYQGPMVHYHYFGMAPDAAPCILVLATGEKRCLRTIPRLVPEGYRLAITALYQWGPDSETIFYTYVYFSTSEEFAMLGNLCIYSLLTSYITCPTQDVGDLYDRSVISYEVSPDQQYIHVCLSRTSLLTDYTDNSKDGVIKVDGSGFFSWKGTIRTKSPDTCSLGAVWRPLP